MKIIDTTTFFEEIMMMEIRFNILNKYIDNFIVCESTHTHSGAKKKINFNPNEYPLFRHKIIHLIQEKEPENLIKDHKLKEENLRFNSIQRIASQRNFIYNSLKHFDQNDYILYSDNDEIPNLNNFDFQKNKNKISIFKQQLFYYKFNLSIPNIAWYGSKGCKLKDLKSIDWLRNIKNKKYNFLRVDTLFSNNRYMNIEIVQSGGWHFSNLKSADGLERKYLNDENHSEYATQNYSKEKILNNLKNKTIGYDHSAKSGTEKRFTETKLSLVDLTKLPNFLQENKSKYSEWFD